jgi:hypothetical protein
MRAVMIAMVAMLGLAGCTTAEKDATLGAAAGATIGAIATGRPSGALAGAVIGGASGVLIGATTRRGYCEYRDRRGRIYVDRCPAGYR